MNILRIRKWSTLKWPGILSLISSWVSVFCWGRYASIHWHGPRNDWIGALLGENMIAYLGASGWISLVALILAIWQIVRTHRQNAATKDVFEIIVLSVSLAAVIMGWLAMT